MTLACSSHAACGCTAQLPGEHHRFGFWRARIVGTSQVIILAPQLLVAVACGDHLHD